MAKKSAAPKGTKNPSTDPRFPHKPRNFRLGGDIVPKADLGRYVRWPRYIRLQRQKKILKQRLKVPPSIHQFSKPLERNPATELFRLLGKYKTESKSEKKERLASGSDSKKLTVKFGINHVSQLVESKTAKLVVIANDVDPLEIVMWLPTLCRRMEVPYVIVNNKSRIGSIVHQKTTTCLAVTEVDGGDQASLEKLCEMARAKFNDNPDAIKEWGGGVMGARTQAKVARHEAALKAEREKKKALMA